MKNEHDIEQGLQTPPVHEGGPVFSLLGEKSSRDETLIEWARKTLSAFKSPKMTGVYYFKVTEAVLVSVEQWPRHKYGEDLLPGVDGGQWRAVGEIGLLDLGNWLDQAIDACDLMTSSPDVSDWLGEMRPLSATLLSDLTSFVHPDNSDFTNLDLRDADLSGRVFYNCKFDDSDLRDVDFRGSVLRHSSFWNADLEGASFDAADVSFSSLEASHPHLANSGLTSPI